MATAGRKEGAVLVATKMRGAPSPTGRGAGACSAPLRTPTPVPRVLPSHHTASQTLTAAWTSVFKARQSLDGQSRGC